MCSDAPAPDPQIGEAAKENARLAEESLNFYKSVYQNDILPMQREDFELRKGLITDLRSSMKQQDKFAREQNEYYKEVYQPVERRSAADAMEYDSEANVNRRRGIAASSVNSQFSNAANQNRRALSAYGINPNSGAFARANNTLTMQQAVASASAQNQAGFETEDRAIALRAGVANFGRNMPNTAAQFYSGAGAAGTNAANISSQGMASVNQNAAGVGAGYNTAMQGNTSSANMLTSLYNSQMQGYIAKNQMIGDLAGSAGMAYGMRRADGGIIHKGKGAVRGPGGPVDDQVPAMLSDGEYVLPADTVKRIGKKKLDAIVKKTHTPAAKQRRGLKGKR